MAETIRQEQVTLLPEYQEKFLKDLLASTAARSADPTVIPDRQIAPLTPGQQQAIQLGYGGVGAFQPMLQAGEATLGAGASAFPNAEFVGFFVTKPSSGAVGLALPTGGVFPSAYPLVEPKLDSVLPIFVDIGV